MNDIKEMRAVYCESLIELAKNNKNIVVIEAYMMNCNKTGDFQ